MSRALAALALAVLLVGQATPATADPALSLVPPVLTLSPGAETGRASFLLQAAGLDAAGLKADAPELTDLGTPNPPTVGFRWTLHERPPVGGNRFWIVVAEVNGLPPGTVQQRAVAVRFNGLTATLPFQLGNKPDTAFDMTVTGPGMAVAIGPREGVPITVSVKGVPASGLSLQHLAVFEQASKRLWAQGHVALCRTPTGRCDPPGTLPANSVQTLYIRAMSTPTAYGHLSGSVTLSAAELPEGRSVPLDVYVSTADRRFFGVPAIAAGLVLAWSVVGWGRARFNRDQALLPAAVLREQLSALSTVLDRLPAALDRGSVQHTRSRLAQLAESLAEQNLVAAGYLPSIVWSAYPGQGGDPTRYQTFLNGVGAWVTALRQVAGDGFTVAWHRLDAGNLTAVEACTQQIDELAQLATPPDAAAVQTAINAALGALSGGPRLAAAGGKPGPTGRALSAQALIIRLRHTSVWAWVVTAAVTVATGSFVLILGNLGFGSAADYLLCALWGIGLPTSASQLGQLTAASAGTALNVKVGG